MSELTEQPVEIRFSRTKSLWFDMIFIVGTQGRIVESSKAMWNILELFDWLEGIVSGESLVAMNVDREGEIDTVAVRHVDEQRCHLRISDWVFDGAEQSDEGISIFVDAIVSRRKLVWEVYYELKSHSADIGWCDSPGEWAGEPAIEKWLDWEKWTNPFSYKDDVTGLERTR